MHGRPAIEEPSAPERPGLQQRLESGRAGRWLISAFLVVTVGGIVIANLPEGSIQQRLAKVTQPYMNATGLDQHWSMYAPYPRKEILYLEARGRARRRTGHGVAHARRRFADRHLP